ncbi:unnamed protein product [Malus baccata var. baccata]
MTSSSVKIKGLLGMLTIKLSDHNYTKLSIQFKLVFKGYKLFDHFDGSAICPSKFMGVLKLELLKNLLITTLSDDDIEYVIGCKTVAKAWANLKDRYALVSNTGINHLKIELHTV